MYREFEISMMGELNFFLRLQIRQEKKGIFINQTKYIRQIIKKFRTSVELDIFLYSRTKHIEIRHHFIKEQVLNGTIFLNYIYSEDQLADISLSH